VEPQICCLESNNYSNNFIIYLAELSHTGCQRSPNTVPLASGYIAAYCKEKYPFLDITIFRDPNQLLEAVKIKPPDLVSFSLYVWSENLSGYCAKTIKQIAGRTVIVVGGASVDDTDPELLQLLTQHPYYDICIPNEGEIGFLSLIEHMMKLGRLCPDTIVAGCARLSSAGSLIRGEYVPPALSSLPSPYLTGTLDQFLQEGYEPIIQSMRGCPYSCAFCVSGTSRWNKLRAFDLERVFLEFNYVKKRTSSNFLILTDENFGILGKRDVALAEFILASNASNGYPKRLYYYSAKITTDSVLRIVETLSTIGEYTISFQTLNDEVRKDIKRTNVNFSQFLEYVEWANHRHIVSSTEMIFGFSGETKESYVSGLERLLHSGVDRIYSYNLRLFSGIDLSTQINRNRYHFQTKYRLPERTYGVYNGEVVTEVEEVVIGTNSFDFQDYLYIRKYGLFLELSSGRGYLSPLMKLLIWCGLPGEKLIRFLAEESYKQYPPLASIVEEYVSRSKMELFDSPDDCLAYVKELISYGKAVPEVKLNFIYTGKIILDAHIRAMFFTVVKDFVDTITVDKNMRLFFHEYIDTILIPQIVSFNPDEHHVTTGISKIRVDVLQENKYHSIDELLNDVPLSLEFRLHNDAVTLIHTKHLESLNDTVLQDIYMSVSRFGLMRIPAIKR